VGYFFFGTNDVLFILSLALFFIEFNELIEHRKLNGSLAFSAFILALFTRELILIYMPVVIICLSFLFKKKQFKPITFLLPLALVIAMLVINIPAISSNGSISYDKKNPPEDVNVTWAQRQYLAQLMSNKGEIGTMQHPSWEQTESYVIINGANSLPRTTWEGVFFDWKLTMIEFIKDFSLSIFYGFRQLGFILPILLYFIIKGLSTRQNLLLYIVPFIVWAMLIIFSFIIISNVELRWLGPVFLLSIIFYVDLINKMRINRFWININILSLILMSIYGTTKILDRIDFSPLLN
tara:strand:- start:326 stop:1207 length:882 start_codon:yes stop_codon:yes gene_type:complete